ncbi:hypothetical protein JCM10212_006509 [Sporobolomyces blumeae]
MTSKDVRDIMQLGPAPGSSSSSLSLQPQPSKRSSGPPGPPVKRPDGITRELYALIGDNAPSLAMAQPVKPKFKERIKSRNSLSGGPGGPDRRGGARWQLVGFTNPSRGAGTPDDQLPDEHARARKKLVLRHWVKDLARDYVDGTPDTKFKRFNTTSQVFSYTDDEYDKWLKADGWSKDETDHLFDLAAEYDLRFIVMADRWQLASDRSVDALKDRYYSICRMLAANRPDPEVTDPAEQEKMDKRRQETVNSFNFDMGREIERKAYLRSLLDRTPAQIAEEDFLYLESRRIEQSYHKIASDRAELLKILGGRGGVGMASGQGGLQLGVGGANKGAAGGEKKKKMPGWEIEGNGNGLPEGWAGEGSKRKATAAQDAANCVERHPAPSVSAPKAHMWPSIAIRSSRIAPVKSNVAQKVSLALSELGLSTQLVMPTKGNIAKLDEVQHALAVMVEAKKAVDRIQAEIRLVKKKKDMLLGIHAAEDEVSIKAEDDDASRQRQKRSASVASSTVSTKRARRE